MHLRHGESRSKVETRSSILSGAFTGKFCQAASESQAASYYSSGPILTEAARGVTVTVSPQSTGSTSSSCKHRRELAPRHWHGHDAVWHHM